MNILLTTFFIGDQTDHLLRATLDHFGHWLIDYFSHHAIDVKFLMNEDLFYKNQSSHTLDFLNPQLFSKEDVNKIFGDNISHDQLYQKIYQQGLTPEEQQKLSCCLQTKLSNWVPDIIFSLGYNSMTNVMKYIYPKALCLTQENAIFSRPPFNRTLSYDPFNSIPNNFLTKYADEINRFVITEQQNKQVEKLKFAIKNLINKYSPLDNDIQFYYKQKFDKLVLLPLVGKKGTSLFQDCICKTELELIEYVMQHTPKNIGVFVTQSDLFATLTSENIDYLKNKYPNFIFLQNTDQRRYASNSLYYFKYIDAVLNITSKTGLMALIWDIPVLSLAKTYNRWYQDGQGMEDLLTVLDNPLRNKNHLLYWYFTRYVIFEQNLLKKDFLWEYVNKKIETFRSHGVDSQFFEPINEMDKIIDYVIPNLLNHYNSQYLDRQDFDFVQQKLKNLWQEKLHSLNFIYKIKRHFQKRRH
ncbi:MAG: hypothetical protein IKP96_05925 [Elusimicrobiaceae bacterium]|nr:hypothetical protein [Elusimicrobiaceae bacterium]